MANADNVGIAKDAAGVMRRASRLAERMARVLRDESLGCYHCHSAAHERR
jgi:hypothetical protein